jgi:hypothetical protein
MKARAHSADWTPENSRRLRLGQSLQVAQDDNLTVSGRKKKHGPPYALDLLAALEVAVRIAYVDERLVQRLGWTFTSPSLPQVVASNAQEKRSQRAALRVEATTPANERDEYVLRDILGSRRAAVHHQREAVDRPLVTAIQLEKRCLISGFGKQHQLGVGDHGQSRH